MARARRARDGGRRPPSRARRAREVVDAAPPLEHAEREMVGAVLLIVPAAAKWMPVLTPLAAAALALETLALAGLYARYSLKLAATNPLVWAVVMGLLSAFVAYGRYA